MAVEDAGTLAELMERLCMKDGSFSLENIDKAMEIYEALRLPRTANVLGKSHKLGKSQQDRANSELYNLYREWDIKFKVWLHGTLPVMLLGATYDYEKGIDDHMKATAEESLPVASWCA